MGVSPATIATSINPLVPYRIVDISLGPAKSIGLGPGILDDESKHLIGDLAQNVIRTKKTIRKLAQEIAKNVQKRGSKR